MERSLHCVSWGNMWIVRLVKSASGRGGVVLLPKDFLFIAAQQYFYFLRSPLTPVVNTVAKILVGIQYHVLIKKALDYLAKFLYT